MPSQEEDINYHQPREEVGNENEEVEHGSTTKRPLFFTKFKQSILAFKKSPFSWLAAVTFVGIMAFASVQQNAKVPTVSTSYPREYFEDAWTDLQILSRDYHPYNSHANDAVHDYILKRASEAVSRQQDNLMANVSDDNPRKIMIAQQPVFDPTQEPEGRVIYYEGNNVLVKIEGSDPSLEAVLLSAHYDSVSTGHGTTDDGVGIASMLGTLRYLIDRNVQPKRSIIFNFNNNEEYGLLGAESFLFHPWSKETGFFINLEGAGALGRPVLFRATDFGVAKHFAQSPNPHGSSLLQQGFQSGLVSSQTDYKVYVDEAKMRGLDIAFYKSRSLYHTKYDNIHSQSLSGLSHMMSSAISVLISMAEAQSYDNNKEELKPAVFFDIFDTTFAVHPLPSLVEWNIVGLVTGPIVVVTFLFWVIKSGAWDIGKRGWSRGIVSLFISTVAVTTALLFLRATNPYIFVSTAYYPLFGTLGLFLLSNYVVLSISWWSKPVHDQKLIVFIELFFILWGGLLYSTIQAVNHHATGLFLVTIVYYSILFAIMIGFLGLLLIKPWAVAHQRHGSDPEQQQQQQDDDENRTDSIEQDETTSLLPSRGRSKNTVARSINGAVHRTSSYDWILQFITVIPVSLYCIYSTGTVVLDALHQTPNEGFNNVTFLCYATGLLSVAIGLLLLPFIHRTNSFVLLCILLGTIFSAWVSLTQFPFTQGSPLKSSVYQEINLDSESDSAVMRIRGDRGYLYDALKELPSIKQSGSIITCEDVGNQQDICSYEALRPWVVNSSDYNDWLNVQVLSDEDTISQGPNKGELIVEAPDNRQCIFEFNTTRFNSGRAPSKKNTSPVRVVTVFHDNDNVTAQGWKNQHNKDVFTRADGIDDFTVWKLDWEESQYHVGIEWIPSWYDDDDEKDKSDKNERLGVTVSCYWGEYDEEILVDGELHRKIPAFDELVEFSPVWTSWTKWKTGLVEVKKYVEL